MITFFERYFSLCLEGSVVLLAVLLLHFLLGRAPKKYICLLWLVALFRLLSPFTVEGPVPAFWEDGQALEVSDASAPLYGNGGFYYDGKYITDDGRSLGGDAYENSADRVQNLLQNVVAGTDTSVTEPEKVQVQDGTGKGENADPDTDRTATEMPERGDGSVFDRAGAFWSALSGREKAALLFGIVWLGGAVVSLCIGGRRYFLLRRELKKAVTVQEWQGKMVKESDIAVTPMVFGIIRPSIYVPVGFQAQIPEREYNLILNHERIHLRRGDHLVKLLSYLVFAIHWWNPLVWLGMRVLQEDLERACDEAVLRNEAGDARSEYAGALLRFAVKKSGLMTPAAFGESNTEKRVKNILNYHKKPFWITVIVLAVVVTAGVCLITRPHGTGGGEYPDSREDQSGQDDRSENDAAQAAEMLGKSYGSYEELLEAGRRRWQERILPADGRLLEGEEVYAIPYYNTNEYVVSAAQRNDEEISLCLVFYTLGRWNIPTVYLSRVDCRGEDGRFFVTGWEDIDIPAITTAAEAQKMDVLLYSRPWKDEPYATDTAWLARQTWADRIITGMLLSSTMEGADLSQKMREPVSALSVLVPLEGGTGQYAPLTEDSGLVTYSFADGTSVNYLMVRDAFAQRWYPFCLVDEELLAQAKETEERVNLVTAEQLRQATIYDINVIEEAGEWYLLSEAGEDAALYGLAGGNAMALRVRDTVYPILLSWASPQGNIPQLYCADYDGDGRTEYAVKTHMRTGTGVSGDELYMIEISGSERTIREFDLRSWSWELSGRIRFEYDEDSRTLEFFADDAYCMLPLDRFAEETGYEFKDLFFGDIMGFEERDGQWYFWAQGGINGKSGEDTVIWYEYGINLVCPVNYGQDGAFTLGQIQAESFFPKNESGDALDRAGKEREAAVLRTDLTHDGIEDTIVVTVTCTDETDALSAQALLHAGEVCLVRVYDGEDSFFDPEKYGDTCGYNTFCAIWEGEYAQAHVGNGQLFLCERDGAAYLLVSDPYFGQGDGGYHYEVFSLDAYGRRYVKEEDSVEFSVESDRILNRPGEEAFPVERMAAYTRALDAWMRDGELIVVTDVDGEVELAGSPAHPSGAQAWRIWQKVLSGWEEELVPFAEEAEPVALTGMDDLEEALRSFYIRLLAFYRADADM